MNYFKILIFLTLSLSMQAFSQASDQTNNNYLRLARTYSSGADSTICEYIKKEIETIESYSTHKIQADLAEEIELIESNRLNESDVELIQSSIQLELSLKDILESKNPKRKLVRGLKSICSNAKKGGVKLLQGLGLFNSAIINTAFIPISFLINLGRGFFSKRDKEELKKRSDFVYRAFGPRKKVSTYILATLGNQSINLLPLKIFSFNPVFFAIQSSIVIEMVINHQCFNLDPNNISRKKFCERYNKLKDTIFKVNKSGFTAGKKLQKKNDIRLAKKRSELSPEAFCKMPRAKQTRRVKRLLKRKNYLKEIDYNSLGILLPVHKNKCAQILMMHDNQEKLDTIKKDLTVIEGVKVYHLLKRAYPDVYFDSDELDKMSLNQQLCHDIEKNRFANIAMEKGDYLVGGIKTALASSILSIPETTAMSIDKELLINDKKALQSNRLKNIIFAIGPQNLNEAEIKNLIQKRKDLYNTIKKDYKRIKRKKSYAECMSYVEENNFDLKKMKETFKKIDDIAKIRDVKSYQELKVIRKYFKKKNKKSKLDWKFVETNDLDNVMKRLRASDIGNVIIISHGRSNGHLVDSKGQEFPKKSSFTDLSPSLMSLNFYSCYSQKLIELYGLKDKLKNESYYKLRFLTNVQENDLFDSNSYAPIVAFGDYFAKLDKELHKAQIGAGLLQAHFQGKLKDQTKDKMCTGDISEIEIEDGSFALVLNDYYIATIDSKSSKNLSFPCRIIKKAEQNKLSIKSINTRLKPQISNLKKFGVTLNGKRIAEDKAKLSLNSFVIFKFN